MCMSRRKIDIVKAREESAEELQAGESGVVDHAEADAVEKA